MSVRNAQQDGKQLLGHLALYLCTKGQALLRAARTLSHISRYMSTARRTEDQAQADEGFLAGNGDERMSERDAVPASHEKIPFIT